VTLQNLVCKKIPLNNIYEKGVRIIPFATRIINVSGMPAPITIPAKTKKSLLSITLPKFKHCLFNTFTSLGLQKTNLSNVNLSIENSYNQQFEKQKQIMNNSILQL